MTTWRLMVFLTPCATGEVVKTHLCPLRFQRSLLADLRARGMGTAHWRLEERAEWGIDRPGMIHANRPWEDFDLPGLKFSVPSEDVLHFLERSRKLDERAFLDGQRYFKLHGWMHCIVLSRAMKVSLERQLEARLHEAEKNAAVFYAGEKPTHQVLREAAASANGLPVELVPDFAGPSEHRNDRFFPKERGQA